MKWRDKLYKEAINKKRKVAQRKSRNMNLQKIPKQNCGSINN